MLSVAIIIFREVLEIFIILSVLLAATRGLKGRRRFISLGVVLGLAGSSLVALFADKISEAVEGMGQEVFNGSILFFASLLIAWTVIWMKKHAKELTVKLKTVGQAVKEGQAPVMTLSVITGLAILREGSEIVLFVAGMLAGGSTYSTITAGSAVGFVAGSLIGLALYFGLLRMSPKHFFDTTAILLIFLAASMASQAAGYFAAAGFLPEWGSPLWNSSSLVADSSIVGQILHALVGYKSRPSGIEVVCFGLMIGGITCLLRQQRLKKS